MLGDARLTLADAPDGTYDLIVVDAFSSDAIPIHLITREAMAIYKAKLTPHGMRGHAHLEPAPRARLGGGRHRGRERPGHAHIDDSTDIDEAANPYKYSGTVAAVARSEEDFGLLAQSRVLGAQARPTRRNGCGPTTIPTSSARCSASSRNSERIVPLQHRRAGRFRQPVRT